MRQSIGHFRVYEELRYNDLFLVFSGKWMWIRFNPDGLLELKDKLKVVQMEIEKAIEAGLNTELVEIKKLFYWNT